MHLNWLEDFECLAETRNFSKTALLRNTTQSALSRRISALEEWVGVELVNRSSQPIELTDAGRVFLATVHQVGRTLKLGIASTRQTALQIEQPVIIAATHMIAFNFFPSWFESLEQQFGELHKQLQCRSIKSCFELLAANESDFVLCPMPKEPLEISSDWNRYDYVEVGSDKLVPVSAPEDNGHPIYTLPGTHTKPTRILSITRGSILGDAVRLVLAEKSKDENLYFDATFESPLKEAVKAMALRGQGIAWLPKRVIEKELLDKQLVVVDEDDSWHVEFKIRCYRKNEKLSPDAQLVWDLLIETYIP